MIRALFRKNQLSWKRSYTFVVVVDATVFDVVVGGGAVVFGLVVIVIVVDGSIVAGSGGIVAFVVDNVREEWLSSLLVSEASLQLCSISKSLGYCRHFFVSYL